MDDARAQTLVRQHAMTARLMGVDFVPCYRIGPKPGAQIEAKPGPARETAAEPDDPAHDLAREARGTSVRLADPAPPTPAPPSTPPGADPGRAAAQAALDALRARYEADAPHKAFNSTFTNLVFGEGDPCARLMFIGEAPGEEEDRTGRPFVGRAGQLLDKMIHAMGLARERVYIANVLKTRPPGNATPTLDEMALCKPYLLEQVAIIGPEVIVSLGRTAAQCLLETDATMSSLRGRWHDLTLPLGLASRAGTTIPTMPTFHPAFLLRSYTQENRMKVWSDLRLAMERLGLPAPAARPD